MAFGDIDFGPDDAKGDVRLAEYFVRIPEYEKVRIGKAAFVIGRKGTGKTAICQMIYDEAQRAPNLFAVFLSFKNAPSADLFASFDKSFRAPNEYISIWKFLIALESAKLILRDESIDPGARAALARFLSDNFGNLDVACLDAVATLRQQEWKVGLDLAEIPLVKLPSAEVGRSASASTVQRIHYGRAATALLAKLRELRSENEFFLLFDELDEDYRPDDRYFHLIISLLKAAYQVRQEMQAGLLLRPIVVLREDIFSLLDDHDLNKMDDMTVRLRWTSLPSEYTEFSLRALVNERIRAHFGLSHGLDLWPTVVDEENWGAPGDSAWGFLVNRTMDRPRDIIKSLKCCQPCEPSNKLTVAGIRASIVDYSQWLYNEIANEIFRVLPEYREAMGLLTRIGQGKFSIQQWRSEFGKEEVLYKKYSSADQVLEMLYNFSVVGILKKGRWLFKYKTPQVTFDIGGQFVVHWGVQKYLVILGPLPREKKS